MCTHYRATLLVLVWSTWHEVDDLLEGWRRQRRFFVRVVVFFFLANDMLPSVTLRIIVYCCTAATAVYRYSSSSIDALMRR